MTGGLDEMTAFGKALLDEIGAATEDAPGYSRDSYGKGEQIAHDILRRVGRELDLEERVDAAGNLYLTLPGRDRALPALYFGSHLDSVPHGGNYDGAAGVVAGAGVLAELIRRGVTPPCDITVMVTRAEEGEWFHLSYPGPEAAFGRLPASALEVRRQDTGRTLREHMRDLGLDPAAVAKGEPQITPDRIAAFVELHIEQGPRLIAAGQPLGVVSAISGGFRYPHARCLGAYAHSGAEPRFSRRDAVLGFSDFVQAIDALWDRLEPLGHEVTFTFGKLATDPEQHGANRVAGEVRFTLDIRCADMGLMAEIERDIGAAVAGIEARRRVSFDLGASFDWASAAMNGSLMRQLKDAGARLAIPVGQMASGAGHDTAVFAEVGVPSVMLFVRNQNGSHNPDEAMEAGDLGLGIALLTEFALAFDPPAR